MKLLFSLFIFISILTFGQEKNAFSVEPINQKQLEDIVLERNEKFLLVNIWASWCIPCREEFPELVKLNKNYESKLDVVAISVDFKDEITKKVIPFLSQSNVNFPVYISDFKNDEELIKYFSSSWNGALPGTFIYDKEGKQILKLEGKQSYESFSSIIDNL